jgi:hypothetical protein
MKGMHLVEIKLKRKNRKRGFAREKVLSILLK